MAGPGTPRADAGAAWIAAIRAVDPQELVRTLPDHAFTADHAGRVFVVGGGKAAAGMAAGVAARLAHLRRAEWSGLVSVPAGCARDVPGIEVRETRPAAINLPTVAVVEATEAMLALVAGAGARDTVVALVSGGGSALLAAPRPGIPLSEKVAVAAFLSAAGAPITAINTVRRAASRVKAGGLARTCRAGRLVALVISDVIGDPLDIIASGPCMPAPPDPAAAVDVLVRFGAISSGVAPRLVEVLLREAEGRQDVGPGAPPTAPDWTTPGGCAVSHALLANNDTAVDAAAAALAARGYAVTTRHARPDDHDAAAEATGRRLFGDAIALRARAGSERRPLAIVEGGEATVRLPADHGRGGRNQQTVLACLAAAADAGPWPEGMVVASIGTDGEDGPTDAAGAVADGTVANAVAADPGGLSRALATCDALPFLESAGGVVRTGPTGTNVADVRIVLARPS